MSDSFLRTYARIGAGVRLEAIDGEIAALLATFPELTRGLGARARPANGHTPAPARRPRQVRARPPATATNGHRPGMTAAILESVAAAPGETLEQLRARVAARLGRPIDRKVIAHVGVTLGKLIAARRIRARGPRGRRRFAPVPA
jgi:hypothetical protein